MTSQALPPPVVKTYTIDEVRRLWAAADDRLRCFMVLALNCGYGQTDISKLRVGEVDWETGVIDRARSKTGVRQRHKLWQVTLDLLKKQKRDGVCGAIFVFPECDDDDLMTTSRSTARWIARHICSRGIADPWSARV